MPFDDRELKLVALAGLRHERQRMDELILRLERELGSSAGDARPKKRRLSPQGRKNIVDAAKRRWAQRKEDVATPAPAPEAAGS